MKSVNYAFASDNTAGVHPKIFAAIEKANAGHVESYGNDPHTMEAKEAFMRHFGKDVVVFLVFGGTGANVLGLTAYTEPFNAVICAEGAHISVDECGAPERFTGCKLLTIPAPNGKITVEGIERHLQGIVGNLHHVQPRVVSLTQPTELGTVYTPKEIREITDFAHRHRLIIHMDGARIANAAVALNVSLRETTFATGVDVLSCGGTKNGMMCGEALLFAKADAATEKAHYLHKQTMQLPSKMRFIAAQFTALLSEDLWRENASHANQMADQLERLLSFKIPCAQTVTTNAVFAKLPGKGYASKIMKKYFFYIWDEERNVVRWMTSFNTTKKEVEEFATYINEVVS